MKNENIDKKNRGLKIGLIVLSIFSTILLIFNLLLFATFKDKDLRIKTLENNLCLVNRSPLSKLDTVNDLENYTVSYNGSTSPVFNQSDIKSHFGESSTTITYNITGVATYLKADETYGFENMEFNTLDYFYSSNVSTIAFKNDLTNISSFLVNTSNYSTFMRSGDSFSMDWTFRSGGELILSGLSGSALSDTNIIWLFNTYFTLSAPDTPSVPDTPDTPEIANNTDFIEIVDISKLNPLIYWSSSLYNNGSLVQTPSTNIINIIGVEFVSNGFLFNKITIRTIALGGLNITLDNNVIDDDTTTAYSGYSCFYNLTYSYESDDRSYSIYVCGVGFHYLPHSTASSNYGVCVNPLEKTWVNEEYKTLNIVSSSSEPCEVPAYTTLSGLELLKLQSDFTSSTLGDTNVFGLLSGAFSAFASILSIRIIPGISIGLLLFIPLVVSIVITIIKLIGK